MFTFRRHYFLLACILFLVEVFIALYIRDRFVRPYVGDFLVVLLLYCFVKAFVNISSVKIAIGVLLFAYIIEFLQYLNMIDRLGLGDDRVARTILGYGFEWQDMVAYTLGIITVLILEKSVFEKE